MFSSLRFAFRQLAKSRGFTVVIVLTLALGIGATTAIFSAVNAIMLRPLPVSQPDRLATISMPLWFPGFSEPVSTRLYEEFRTRAGSFSDLAVVTWREPSPLVALGEGARDTDFAGVQAVSGNFFSTLGVPALLGRTLVASDDRRDDPQRAIVISENFWRQRFAADPAIVGKVVRIEDVALTIVGVAARGFSGVVAGENVNAWIPLQIHQLLDSERTTPDEDDWLGLAIGRLRPGISFATARAELDLIFQQDLARRAAHVNLKNPEMRRRFVGRTLALDPGATGFHNRGSLRWKFANPIAVLMAAAGAVLLVACANVAGLLLARGAARQREFAVRAALGAGRGRIIRQFLAESLLLSAAGGALGVIVAQGGARFLARFLPEDNAAMDFGVDVRVLGFAVLVTTIVGLLCGLVPALRLSRIDLTTALKNQGGTIAGASGQTFNRLLVVLQIALSCTLLAAAGILTRSLHNLRTFDAGFARDHLMTFTLDAGKDYAGPRGIPLYRRVLERLQALPGVRGATLSAQMPLVSGGAGTRFKVPGYVPAPDEVPTANFLEIGPRFFATLGLTGLRGRDFTEADFADRAPPVGIIGETMARHFWPGVDPIGQHFTWGKQSVEIVGVVPDMKSYDWVREPSRFTFYRPYVALDEQLHHVRFQVRTIGDPRGLAAAIRSAVKETEPRARVLELRTMDEAVDAQLLTERAVAQISTFFGVFALTLACLGLYGLLAYGVVRRTREIGVRMALGAQLRDIVSLVLKQGLGLAVFGSVLGIAGAFATTRLIGGFLYGVGAFDPVTFATTVLVMLGVALLACWLPARRAAKVDPMIALRAE